MTDYEIARLALAQHGNLVATMEQQTAAMRAAEQQHQTTMEALRQQNEALRVLIERTAPAHD